MCKASGKLSEVMEGLIDGKTAKTLCSDTDIRKFQKNLRHDLRNPISAIKGYGEMLLEDLQDPGVEALRSEIVTLLDEVQFLLSQLYEIVEFSSPAQGRGCQPLEGASSHSMTHVEAPEAGVRSAGGGARRFESGKILVVHDIEENRELLVRRLSHEGHDVKAAESGEKALQLLHSQKFELVLLDVVMPDMDGYEVLARIKGDNGLRDIPVVMVSELDEMESVIRCIETGAEDYLPKSVNPILLRARVNSCLEKKKWLDRQREYIDRLAVAMKQVENGHLDVLLEITSGDIYAELYEGFNLMTAGLREESRILAVAHDLSGELHIDVLLARIIHTTTELLNADRSTLFVYDRKTDELWSRVLEGAEIQEIRIPSDKGLAGMVFQSGKFQNISDPYQHPAFNPEVDRLTGYKTESILCMPIVTKDGATVGVTQVLNKKGGQFTAQDESRLGAFTAQIAVALHNAQLFDEVLNVTNYNESILKSTSNGLITLDTDQNIVTANDQVLSFMGVERDSLIGNPVKSLFGNANSWVMDGISKVATSGDPDTAVDASVVLADGKEASVNLAVVPLIDVNEELIGTMLIIEDITTEKRVKTTMARYMSKEVADQLLEAGEAELRGKNQRVSILFSDIRNFTTTSEVLDARETVSMLNEYFTDMVDVIFKYGGILDKHIGDAIMALFGVPFNKAGDADNAIRVANEMILALVQLNERRKLQRKAMIDIRIGISTGEVIAGTIGSPRRLESTVIGDSVNLASRLESANKFYNTRVLVSEDTVRDLGVPVAVREIDLIRVKGRDQPVAVFEPLDYHTPDSFPGMGDVLKAYTQGLRCYRNQDWGAAVAMFERALTANSEDRPSQIYLDRCRQYVKTPPSEQWDGV